MKRAIRFLLGLAVLLTSIILVKFTWLFDFAFCHFYDVVVKQSPVVEDPTIEKQLEELQQISFNELTDEEKYPFEEDFIKCKSLANFYQKKKYYVVNGFDRYRYVVGQTRFNDFFSADRLFKENIEIPIINKTLYTKNTVKIPNLAQRQILLIEPALLKTMLALNKELIRQGYNADYIINSGFRNPYYNDIVGGKSCSRHQHGEAVDIKVRDINNDGKINAEDKSIVYDILDKKIIKNSGGLGHYKSSEVIIHFDVRGYRARWYY